MRVDQQTWERQWLPQRPLASDDLRQGIYRMSRENALELRYIEANPQAISNLLVVDIDHEDALLRAVWGRKAWMPNALVENPANGHAHALWVLSEPVTRTEYARRKPLAFAAAVTEGLRRSVDGDQAYSGLITKNPTHDAWSASWLTDHLYRLPELHAHLDATGFMPRPSWARTRRKHPVGMGRNCALFETARTWAYREIRNHWGDPIGLYEAITAKAHLLNADYSEPLPISEVHAISKSIHKWITTRSRMWHDGQVVYEANFIAIQSARGRRPRPGRRTEAEERASKIEIQL